MGGGSLIQTSFYFNTDVNYFIVPNHTSSARARLNYSNEGNAENPFIAPQHFCLDLSVLSVLDVKQDSSL